MYMYVCVYIYIYITWTQATNLENKTYNITNTLHITSSNLKQADQETLNFGSQTLKS